MVKTLLLCFIHGFKGDEETFYEFPEHLKTHVARKRPELNLYTAVYPKYETRGDLAACVTTFREWLQDQVTNLERDAATPLAILNPSVSVILVAHSMGGFVAADTLFSVLDNRPISADPNMKLMFPLIQGVIAFDTPYNGLSRSMFAYGAFSQYQNISSVWNILSTVSSFGAGASTSQILASQGGSSWRQWQALAARTGTYGAIVAGGVAAYVNRAEIAQSLSKVNKESIVQSLAMVNKENLSQGWTYVSRDSVGEGFAWMASHLKFVGALMKQAQLKARLDRLSELKGIGVVNIYSSLGENGYWSGGYFVPKRTFCAIPTEAQAVRFFKEQANPKAGNEIEAHCSMFRQDKNPEYNAMIESAGGFVCEWLKNDPRQVVDEYKPDEEQNARRKSEAEFCDDDGEILNQNAQGMDETSEEEIQLQSILSQEIAQSKDASEPLAVSEEALQHAADVPLIVDEDDKDKHEPATWRSRILSPLNSISVPSFRIPGRAQKEMQESVDGKDSKEAPKIPLPETSSEEPKAQNDEAPTGDETVQESGSPTKGDVLKEAPIVQEVKVFEAPKESGQPGEEVLRQDEQKA